MTERVTDEAVITWLSSYLGIRSSKIKATSRICEDLGVDGDDASELLDAYAKAFGVDCRNFRSARYFGPEAGAHILSPLLWIGSFFRANREYFLVKDLIEGAKKGSLL